MQAKRQFVTSILILASAALLIAACGAKEGEEGGPCLTGSTCNEGLTCVSEVCEKPSSSGGLFSQIYASTYFQKCKNCHSPSPAMPQPEIEKTLDWSTQAKAYSTTKTGKVSAASGTGLEDCNGVSFVGSTPAQSIIVAVFDETIRGAFVAASKASCKGVSLTNMNDKVGSTIPSTDLANLKSWITAGAPEN